MVPFVLWRELPDSPSFYPKCLRLFVSLWRESRPSSLSIQGSSGFSRHFGENPLPLPLSIQGTSDFSTHFGERWSSLLVKVLTPRRSTND
ncbi:hypothetical protein TSAR_003543 [Trichomalopsis sarcophagae]|uniref:Uncharacterized protein n=1 Tax=Trichomalopsis sarcophagae TaxID=543379 RepID=A0A232FEV1_9HYME|nr:hypothetical protein TSAR_003543 [Trichomalopsis sarcophagae]